MSGREEAEPLLGDAANQEPINPTLERGRNHSRHHQQHRHHSRHSSNGSARRHGRRKSRSRTSSRVSSRDVTDAADVMETGGADRLHDEEDRLPEHALSNCDTIIHLLKGNIGTGILAMPDAIKNSGLWVGSIGLIFMSLICVTCMHLLVKCSHTVSSRINAPFLSYEDLTEAAFQTAPSRTLKRFSKSARAIICTFLCITQLGFCCVYFVFVAQNLKMVFDITLGKLEYHVYMVIVLVPLLLLVSIRNLRYLSPISMLANLLQFLGLSMIFYYLLQDMPYSWERKAFASWGQLPLYFGTAIYAFEGIGVVLPIENQMKTPRDLLGYNGVLNTSMVIVTCLYIAVGFFGYLKYGDDVLGSITLNLPVEEPLAKVVIIMMALAIFFSYGIQFYVPIQILLPFFVARVPEAYHLITEYALRFALVLLTFALGAAIPRLDLFISLVGAISSSTLALIAPPIIDTVTFWPMETEGTWYSLRMLRNLTFLVIGVVGFLTGSYVSLSQIISFFVNGV